MATLLTDSSAVLVKCETLFLKNTLFHSQVDFQSYQEELKQITYANSMSLMTSTWCRALEKFNWDVHTFPYFSCQITKLTFFFFFSNWFDVLILCFFRFARLVTKQGSEFL